MGLDKHSERVMTSLLRKQTCRILTNFRTPARLTLGVIFFSERGSSSGRKSFSSRFVTNLIKENRQKLCFSRRANNQVLFLFRGNISDSRF